MNRLTTYALGLHRPVPSVWEADTQITGGGTQACMAAVLSICVFLLAACTDGSSSPRSASTPVAAEVAVVRQARLPVTNDVTGNVVSDGRIDVASRVTGFIRQLDVRAYSDENRHPFQSNVGHYFQRKPCRLFRLNPSQSFRSKVGH